VQCPEESTKEVSKATNHTKNMSISSNYRKLDIILKTCGGGMHLHRNAHKESKNAKKNREESIRQLLRLQTKFQNIDKKIGGQQTKNFVCQRKKRGKRKETWMRTSS